MSVNRMALFPVCSNSRRAAISVLGTRVGFSGSSDRTALFRVGPSSIGMCTVCGRKRCARRSNNDVIMPSLVTKTTGNCKLGHDCRRVRSHRRRDATQLDS